MPCTDANAMNGKVRTEITNPSHQQENPLSDACSPFCSCSCCTGSPIPQYISKSILVKPELIKSYNPVYSSPIKEISLSIWQPPQLA
jgi:hypothetical protein